MSSRAEGVRTLSKPLGRESVRGSAVKAANRGAWAQRRWPQIRVAILTATLLIAVYAAVAVVRMHASPIDREAERAGDQAAATADRIDTQVATLRAALSTAAMARKRFNGAPLDTAQTVLAAAQGLAPAAAVAQDAAVVATAGAARGVEWSVAARAALQSGQPEPSPEDP